MKVNDFVCIEKAGWKAVICPSLGATTVSLNYDGKRIIHPAETNTLECITWYTNGIQLLLPPNRTENAQFSFEGKTYYLEMNEIERHNHAHGFLNKSNFIVENCDSSSFKAKYINKGEIFPFPFEITVFFSLTDNGYLQSFSIKNTGNSVMPLTFGLHTNFEMPEKFTVPIEKRWVCNENYIPTGELENLTASEKMFITGNEGNIFPISGFYTAKGHTASADDVYYSVSENFDQWILYNDDGKQGFLSIEPQCGAVNALNSGIGLKRLASGETETFYTKIYKEKGICAYETFTKSPG